MKAIYFLCIFLSTTFLGLSKNYLVDTKVVTKDHEGKVNYYEDSEYNEDRMEFGSEYDVDEDLSEYDDDDDDDEDDETTANDEQFDHLPGGGD